MSVKNKFLMIVALFVLVSLLLLRFAQILTEGISQLDRSWELHSEQVEKKADAIHQLSQSFGYGVFIHHFKNLVLRLDADYLSRSSNALANTYAAIDYYRSLPITSAETAAVDRFAATVDEYGSRLQQLKTFLGQGFSQAELDARVRVDDSRALQALSELNRSIQAQGAKAKQKNKAQLELSLNLLRDQVILLIVIFPAVGFIFALMIIRLSKSLSELKTIFSASPDALMVSDLSGKIRHVNQKAMAVFGYSEKEFLELSIEDLVPQQFRGSHQQKREHFQQSNRTAAMDQRGVEFFGLKKNGQQFPAEIAISSYASGNSRACIAIIRDVSDKKQLEKRGNTDHMTQLANRRQADLTLVEEIARSHRYGRGLAIILCDIDHFKQINDRFGHEEGDQALIRLSRHLEQRVRTEDSVARWGGEEFLIISPETDLQGAAELAEQIRISLNQLPTEATVEFTISFGVAALQLGDDEHSLIKRADSALYRAKNSGRNRVEVASEDS